MWSAPGDTPAPWHKSTRSGGSGDCVEVARPAGVVLVRDSKDPDGPVLRFGLPAWRDFVAAVRAGSFDRPAG